MPLLPIDGEIETVEPSNLRAHLFGRNGLTIFSPHPHRQRCDVVLKGIEMYSVAGCNWSGTDSTNSNWISVARRMSKRSTIDRTKR